MFHSAKTAPVAAFALAIVKDSSELVSISTEKALPDAVQINSMKNRNALADNRSICAMIDQSDLFIG